MLPDPWSWKRRDSSRITEKKNPESYNINMKLLFDMVEKEALRICILSARYVNVKMFANIIYSEGNIEMQWNLSANINTMNERNIPTLNYVYIAANAAITFVYCENIFLDRFSTQDVIVLEPIQCRDFFFCRFRFNFCGIAAKVKTECTEKGGVVLSCWYWKPM